MNSAIIIHNHLQKDIFISLDLLFWQTEKIIFAELTHAKMQFSYF